MVIGKFYASDGTFITTAQAPVDFTPLMPGQTTPFQAIAWDNPLITECRVTFKRLFDGEVQTQR